jgi:hypothetical protein
MRDPLRDARERLAALVDSIGPAPPQRELFPSEAPAEAIAGEPAAVRRGTGR